MNITNRKSWKSNLYLDSLGSSAVIVASVLIFLFVAITDVTEVAPASEQLVDVCPPGRFATVEYGDQRPNAARPQTRVDCA